MDDGDIGAQIENGGREIKRARGEERLKARLKLPIPDPRLSPTPVPERQTVSSCCDGNKNFRR